MAGTFDFVVVGAGSAGCVLAEGLSARHSVALIEAGAHDRGLAVAIPAAFKKLFRTGRDWQYESEPEPNAADRRLYLPRGKMLGGSSSMNAMIYVRGRPSDLETWVELGADGWGWDDVLPSFVAMERNSRGASVHHGVEGRLIVEDLRSPNGHTRRFIEAAVDCGHPVCLDFNVGTPEGVGLYQVTQRRGRRWSAADAFLRPALRRENVHLISPALATRVVLEGGRAIGIDYLRDGVVERAHARFEVILSAGAFGSPHLLQLSGIGDPSHLEGIGVETVVENRHVGRHLQDHPVVGVIQRSLAGGTLDDAERADELVKWLLTRRGRLTSNVAEAGAFLKSSHRLAEPDLQFHFGPVYFVDHGLSPFQGHAFSLGALLLNPVSRGTVLAGSADPSRLPLVRGNYLSDPDEVAALVRGVEMAREILAASAFDDVRGEELLPGADVTSRDDLERFVRERVEMLYHPVGTCRIGRDGSGVVDSDLRVQGVEGLRVADASVMPRIVSGNTNATTMMIGARAVDKLLAQESKGSTS
jgi:choline dehydrogenase